MPTPLSVHPSLSRPTMAQLAADLALLVGIVLAGYGLRLDVLPLCGEETRWARCAVEMLQSGDYLVPRQQGEPFLSRPPLHHWLIAAGGWLRGGVDIAAVRWPSVVALALTAAAVYLYALRFVGRTGAVVAGLAYATMGQTLKVGGLGESDAVFVLLCGGSLLAWHGLATGGGPHWRAWAAGGALAGLAALAKGPQPPVYFFGGVGVYLLLAGQARQLLGRGPWIGAGAFVAVVAAWQIPFFASQGWPGTLEVWGWELSKRFEDRTLATFLTHLATFPAEALGGMLPWSLLLPALLHPGVRRGLGPARPALLFAVACLLVAFPSVWLPPMGRGRYLMPMFPLVAVLAGAAAQGLAAAAAPRAAVLAGRRVGLAVAAAMAGIGVAVAAAVFWKAAGGSLGRWDWLAGDPLRQPPALAGAFLGATLVLAGLAAWGARQRDWRTLPLAVAGFLALASAGPVLNAQAARAADFREPLAALRRQLPTDEPPPSLGPAFHVMTYHVGQAWGRNVPLLPRPATASDVPADLDYFCVHQEGERVQELPFAWEAVAVLSCDRLRTDRPSDRMIVGRRLRPLARKSP